MMQINGADVTVLWSMPNGVRCVLRPYDESRFQLRLVREQGTIKSDLFSAYGEAVDAALDWQRQLRPATRSGD